MRFEIVRDCSVGSTEPLHNYERHPAQPANGFASATDAVRWCEMPPRSLGGDWYVQPVSDPQPARLEATQ